VRDGYTSVSTVTGIWVATAIPSLGALAAERDSNPTYPPASVMDTLEVACDTSAQVKSETESADGPPGDLTAGRV
jgi:hypothetical protein